MCIIFWAQDAQYQLILAANRDEFLSRPTTRAAFHSFSHDSLSPTPNDEHSVLSGLDLTAGGTWLGVSLPAAFSSSTGERLRFATLTNYTEVIPPIPRPSRGELVKDWLYSTSGEGMDGYLRRVEQAKESYAGFNLVLGSLTAGGEWEMGYVSNREPLGREGRKVQMPGEGAALAVSNATLGVREGENEWPKVREGCRALQSAVLGAQGEQDLVDRLWTVLSTAHPTPIRHRLHLRHTVLVQPTFIDPTAPLPANPPPFAEAGSSPAPPPTQLPAGLEGKVEGKEGYWYATRVQTVLLIERERDGLKVRVSFIEREGYALNAEGRPEWQPEERVFEFVV